MAERCRNCGYPHSTKDPVFILEKRKADGSLDFSTPVPPFVYGTQEDLFQHYFAKNPGVEKASQEDIKAWYAGQNLFWRPKTW
jgi:hypothetical protein